MSTIADKLAYLAETKNQIKASIIEKGVDVPDDTPFREYANKIAAIEASTTSYVVGEPVELILSTANWNGSRYTATVEGYKVGSYGLKIGVPSDSSVINTQAMIEAALTVSDHSFTAADAENGTAAYTTIVIAAVNTPAIDLTIWLFGLEVTE